MHTVFPGLEGRREGSGWRRERQVPCLLFCMSRYGAYLCCVSSCCHLCHFWMESTLTFPVWFPMTLGNFTGEKKKVFSTELKERSPSVESEAALLTPYHQWLKHQCSMLAVDAWDFFFLIVVVLCSDFCAFPWVNWLPNEILALQWNTLEVLSWWFCCFFTFYSFMHFSDLRYKIQCLY